MANNPVQIVLNSQNYVQRVETQPGGKNTDFFAGRDGDFIEHKTQLANSIGTMLPGALHDSPLVYAHVELQERAWAKSHRPTLQVFPRKKIRSTSGNQLGTLIVELTPKDLKDIQDKILSAEDQTKWVIDEKSGKPTPKPSRLRSEVGAIKEIRIYSNHDRRKFSIEQAVKWLADPRTGGAYYVESFVLAHESEDSQNPARSALAEKLILQFKQGLNSLQLPIIVSTIKTEWAKNVLFVIQLPEAEKQNIDIHNKLISYIDSHPAVRAVLLPPILQSAQMNSDEKEAISFPSADDNSSYPLVGIIDTGVAEIGVLSPWRAGGVDFIDQSLQDTSHGTFIAGLIAGSKHLNTGIEFEESECKFYDIGIHPTYDYESYYPRGFFDFLEQLDTELEEAIKAGVRIFNMSLSVTLPVEDGSYSLFANILDQMADKHDVIFVLPSGNLDGLTSRDEWPEGDENCLKFLAEYRHQGKDRIFQPADSVRSITVGALDPACPKGQLKPSRYTRRGPGPSLGSKPDVAHIGGKLDDDHGLYSLTPRGGVSSNCGTSFASPLVAKTLATLDHSIEGYIQREALTALLLHNSTVPKFLNSKKLSRIAKDFVGTGIPKAASPALAIDDHQITLVFNGVLLPGHELIFDFAWPACLVNDGKCSGKVKVTTVYRPPIDRNFGAEFILANVDTWLRQEIIDKDTGEISFKNRLKGDTDKSIEKERIAHGAKWWPVKSSDTTFSRGVGESSQWRLVLESLARSGYALPEEGIHFSTVITISDPSGKGNVFNETRQQLQASGVEISDIRSALSSRLRPTSRN
ncbi:MAG: S8 family peptidase [Pseudomonas sp.]|uniref:S8 family peptidase n=1 Tax=Pseudomonas sp. TaxID=306 RepID=UPI002728D8BA|nr:S8 family peptidase [Pseudomonas sp.]MDO9616217.1 S8 family peptidase [Pseudomonas sp.]MDP2447790.1 S8 family peptidase [Pseudomonas sp.]